MQINFSLAGKLEDAFKTSLFTHFKIKKIEFYRHLSLTQFHFVFSKILAFLVNNCWHYVVEDNDFSEYFAIMHLHFFLPSNIKCTLCLKF